MSSPSVDQVRVATWNLRWFPDGGPRGRSERETDVDWLACAVASLGVAAIAVQEVMLHPRGRRALERLLTELSARTGGRWESRFDACPRDGRQHVGLLFDAARVEVGSVTMLPELNPGGTGCSHRLRPGLALDLRFRSGLDLYLVVVHFDSGREDHDLANRRRAVRGLAPALHRLRALRQDDDVMVLGDFNAMGCGSCEVERGAELAEIDAAAAGMWPSLTRASSSVACTEFYRGRGTALDQVLVSDSLGGVEVAAEGLCAGGGCRIDPAHAPAAFRRLSDHCPVVVTLR